MHGSEVVALGGVVTKTVARVWVFILGSMRGLSNPGSEFSNSSSQFSGFSFQIA